MRVVPLLFHDVYAGAPSESGFCSPAADRYKLTVVDFEAQLEGLSGVSNCRQLEPIGLLDPILGKGPCFTITVDDGGLSYYTQVADRFESRGWRGACFIPTDFIGRPGFLDRTAIRELDARGHAIGSHSASHPARFSTLSGQRMRREWMKSRATLEDLLGHPVVTASVPGGYFSSAVAAAAADSGIQLLFTSEPVTTRRYLYGCVIAGRFTIRARCRRGLARAFVSRSPWARTAAWASWNAKGAIKPLLGASYPRVAEWLVAARPFGR